MAPQGSRTHHKLASHRLAGVRCLVWAVALLLVCSPGRADTATDAQGSDGIELTSPLTIGNKEIKGRVVPADTEGMLDEPVDTFRQPLLLAPPTSDGLPANFNKWVRVRTCREWMRLHAEGWNALDTVDQGADSIFLRACGTLFAVQTGHPAKVSYLPLKGLGDIRLYSPLLLDFSASEQQERNQRLAGGGRSFGDLGQDPNSPITISSARYPLARYLRPFGDLVSDREIVVSEMSDERVAYFYDGSWQSINLIARGDFTGDGVEDFLVHFIYSGGGSFTGHELLVLTR